MKKRTAYIDRAKFRDFLAEKKISVSSRQWIEKSHPDHKEYYKAILDYVVSNVKFKEERYIEKANEVIINGCIRYHLPIHAQRALTVVEEEFINNASLQFTYLNDNDTNIANINFEEVLDAQVTENETELRQSWEYVNCDINPSEYFIDVVDVPEELILRLSVFRFVHSIKKLEVKDKLDLADVVGKDLVIEDGNVKVVE
ncbi:virion structural protein [Pseudomonas phage vB_Pae10145-KEN51]|uniref:PHIKZ228 n=6 Tax=root TaxID=1 RepID=Q8SCT4_BPDPK|nr:hypothetical protein [Pseudomonas aeruginosa]NP_803794.1 virion structural protein [Pseudomonas phage phiKZ]YP_009617423.1 virion structural protein [Pseudomonas phage PA7]ANM45031.1 structural protein [Pseudomonas phage KTN4]QJB22908.1 hypothetical protein fnug_265 [Pseudomonas phage fnug]QOV08120.1 hypothetical protein [Pseudomonas phage vB_PaeM_kmuB]QYV98905.1 hypothetical protein [Pseudomonas phage T2P]QYV99429.1 hypothetical protein [Pseudomonas phage U1B]QYV99519.1 hypothetical pro